MPPQRGRSRSAVPRARRTRRTQGRQGATACDGARGPGTAQGQELVFIGTDLRADALRAALASCLLAEGEPAPAEDEFPAWETYGIDAACEHEHAA